MNKEDGVTLSKVLLATCRLMKLAAPTHSWEGARYDLIWQKGENDKKPLSE